MNLNRIVDKAICLVLDKRYDDWSQKVLPQLKILGVEVEAFIAGDGGYNLEYDHIDSQELPVYCGGIDYPTWYKRPNAYNAWKCHKKMLEQCVEQDVEYVLFLEDDVQVHEDYEEVTRQAIRDLSYNHIDMLYLGHYGTKHNSRKTNVPNVVRMSGGGGWHSVIIHNRVMKQLLRINDVPYGPFDWQCGQQIHKQFDCYGLNPSVITQIDGHSYVEGHHLDKPGRHIQWD
jgi:hypothetical protein